jgi:hypothetical protein
MRERTKVVKVVVLSKLGRGEVLDYINNRLNAIRSRDRNEGVAGE